MSIIPNTEIILNQQAISELSKDIEWRQGILAYSKTTEDSKEIYTELIRWSKAKEQKTPIVLTIISFLFPAIYFVALGGMISAIGGPLFMVLKTLADAGTHMVEHYLFQKSSKN